MSAAQTDGLDLAWAWVKDLMIEQDEILGEELGEVPPKLSKEKLDRLADIRERLREVMEAMERSLARTDAAKVADLGGGR